MGGETLRSYLKMQNLFVRDINRAATPAAVRATLEKAAGPLCKIVIPLDNATTTSHLGIAYLNFGTQEEATRCLDKYRFKLMFKGDMAKVMYSPYHTTDKDRVFGPYSRKFQVIVKNLSEEVTVSMLFDFFSQFGEVYQCKTDRDVYDQYYGQLTYLDEDSVAKAVAGANHTRWHSSVIQVDLHHKAHLAGNVAPPAQPPPQPSSLTSFPALGVASSNGVAAAAAAAAPTASAGASAPQQPSLFASTAHANGNGLAAAGLAPGGSTPLSALDVPVAAPLPLRGQPVGSLLASTGSSGSPIKAPQAQRQAAPALSDLSSLAGAPVAAQPARQAAGGVPLLQLLDRRRAEVAASSGVSPCPTPPPQCDTPPGSSARGGGGGSGASRLRGGLIKSIIKSLDNLSEHLVCPITSEVFQDPVVAADGITYERAAITAWLSSGHETSPLHNTPLAHQLLTPNTLVRQLVDELL